MILEPGAKNKTMIKCEGMFLRVGIYSMEEVESERRIWLKDEHVYGQNGYYSTFYCTRLAATGTIQLAKYYVGSASAK